MNKSVVIKSTVICATSGILMVVAQLPTPDELNPLGAFFGLIFLGAGMVSGMVAFALMLDKTTKRSD